MKRIILNNITKDFRIGSKKRIRLLEGIFYSLSGLSKETIFRALDDVSFDVNSGEIVGLIGENGCGKSTILRVISDIYINYSGQKITRGKLVPLINLQSAMARRLTLKDNVFLIGAFLDMGRNEIKEKFNSIVEFADLEEFVDTKIYQFSAGMRQRLIFSMAIHANPDIFLLDEIFAVGDEKFRLKSANKIKEFVSKGASAILVSHEPWMIREYCDRVIWMEDGKIKKIGDTDEVLDEYLMSSKGKLKKKVVNKTRWKN